MSTRRFLAYFFCILLSGCASLGSDAADDPAPVGFYANPEKGWGFVPPENWTVRDLSGVKEAILFSQPVAPPVFPSTILVLAKAPPPGETQLAPFVEELLSQLERSVKDFKLVSRANATLAGEPAVALVSTESHSNNETLAHRVVALDDANVVLVEALHAKATSDHEAFAAFLNERLATFRFL